jgi:hypothetical protein
LLTTAPEVAVIFVISKLLTVLPTAIPVLDIFAAVVLEDFQITASVTSTEVPSLRNAIALKAWVSPERIDAELGATTMESTWLRVIIADAVPVLSSFEAVIVTVPADTP